MNKFQQYEAEKSKWLADHKDASPADIEVAFAAIAKRLGI